MKLSAMRPAVISAMGKPRKAFGGSANSSRYRMLAKSTMASRKPTPPVMP